MPEIAVVFTGGSPPGAGAVSGLPSDRFVVAADSGLHHAMALGIGVDVAVGDFDSVDGDALRAAQAAGTVVDRHAATKDQTDLELALDHAASSGAARLLVVGGRGGRLDHSLGNVATFCSSRYEGLSVEARSGSSRLFVVRKHVGFAGTVGEYVSLVPWGEAVEGVRTTGLKWELHGERLEVGSSRGVSNELTATIGEVEVRAGVLLVILPGERSPLSEGAIPEP